MRKNKNNSNPVPIFVMCITFVVMFLLFLVGMKVHRAAPISWEIIACIGALLLIPPVVVELADVVLQKLCIWKIKRKIKKLNKLLPGIAAPSSEALEFHAVIVGVEERRPGETDAELRARILEKIKEPPKELPYWHEERSNKE